MSPKSSWVMGWVESHTFFWAMYWAVASSTRWACSMTLTPASIALRTATDV
jgi:hypothetical protein